MLLLGILVVATFALRLALLWAIAELRSPMTEAGPWLQRSWAISMAAAGLLTLDAMLSFATHPQSAEMEPLLWQINHVGIPLLTAALLLIAALCAITHTAATKRRRERGE